MMRLLLFLILLPAIAAADVQPLQSIRDAAHALVQGDATAEDRGVEVGRLDPRLRLARCDRPLEAFFPPGSRQDGNTTVGVRCNGTRPWSLYVPVRVVVRRPIAVTTRPLPAGAVLGADDIALETRDIDRLSSDYFPSTADVTGKELSRSVNAGQVLTSQHLRNRKLVLRGQRVTLLVAQGGFEVRMVGTALDDGAAGQRVRVKNASSSRVVEGTVEPDGSVVITF